MSTTIGWLNLPLPEFEIAYSPNPILSTNMVTTVFRIVGLNFDNSTSVYDYDWIIIPYSSLTQCYSS